MIEIRLLGQFELRRAGAVIDLPARAAQSLLAYLLLNAGVAQRRERLAGLLWPDSSESNARRNLRQALWQIRRALGPEEEGLITADDLTITGHGHPHCWLDVALLQRTTADASVATLLEVATVYGGELLPGFYDEWVLIERERLHAQYERCMALLLEQLVQTADWSAVLTWGERWIAAGGVPEPAYRALMSAHAALGDRAAVAEVYRRCVEALERDLAVPPSPQTQTLYDHLQQEVPIAKGVHRASAPIRPRSNLPVQWTSFIGRAHELTEITRLLTPGAEPGVRLLTLTGPGGTGKTRLALQASARLLDAFADGVWWVELALLNDPELLPQAVAEVCDVREEAGVPVTRTLVDALRPRTLLLILDNAEHLIDPCARLVEALLRGCPHIRLLLTSRETLGITGESVLRVPSLSLPDRQNLPALSDLAESEAVRLFCERALAVRPEFQLNESNAAAIAQICAQLDGVPLAIELAAARIRAMSPEQIAARLDDRFRLLTGGSRTALPRQQTLRALIDWSWDLLSDAERVLLRRLTVFAGGWTLDAAEAICGVGSSAVSATLTFDVLEVLTHLVEKSLVMVEEQGGETRYRLLETIRQYAREKLVGEDEVVAVRAAHLDYFLRLAETAEPALRGADQLRWLARLETEHDNLRVGLQWAAGDATPACGLRLAGSLAPFWYLRGYWNEGRTWHRHFLSQPVGDQPDDELIQARINALCGAAWLADEDGSEVPLYTESLTLCRRVGDRWGEAFSLRGLAGSSFNRGDREAARQRLHASLAIFTELNDDWGIAIVHFNLGWLTIDADLLRAEALWSEGLARFRHVGDRWGISVSLGALGYVARIHGDYGQAQRLIEESLACFRALGDKAGVALSLGRLAGVAYRRADYADAQALLEQSQALNKDRADELGQVSTNWLFGLIDCAQGEYASAHAYLEEAITLARKRGNRSELSTGFNYQAFVYYSEGALDQAAQRFGEGLALAQETDEREDIADALHGLGLVALAQGDRDAASRHLTESLARYRERGDQRHLADALDAMSRLALAQDDRAGALRHAQEALRLRQSMADKRGIAESLERFAVLTREPEQAVRLLAAAQALRRGIGAPIPPIEQPLHLEQRQSLQRILGEDGYQTAWRAGLQISTEQAILQALQIE
jgi:non-specific serine/threonine protein kinase